MLRIKSENPCDWLKIEADQNSSHELKFERLYYGTDDACQQVMTPRHGLIHCDYWVVVTVSSFSTSQLTSTTSTNFWIEALKKSNTWENTTQKSSLIVLTHNIWKQTCEVRRVGEFLIGTDRGVGGSWGVGGLICQRRLWIWHHAFVISVSSAPLGRLSKLNEGKINIKILTIIF